MGSHYDYLYEEFCWDQGYSPFEDYGFYPFLDYMREEEPSIEDELAETKELLTNMTEAMMLMTKNMADHSEFFDTIYRIQNKTVDMITDIENRLNRRA